ncbi:MAG TPA: Mur ligase family protein, partial [Anaerolineales bacterium]
MDSQPWRQPLEQLAGFTDLSAQPQAQLHAGDFSLAAIERLLSALGRPERSYAVLHVAGTNGKGSVAALCAAALQAQGYRVGLFTSPHLAGHFAGVQLDGQAIPPQQASAQLAAMQTAIEQQPSLTQFEIVTALALRYFAEHQVDIAVVEAGLGGRLDATNVVLPAVSVITAIDLEHRSILGNSLAAIAGHKAGIIKA